MHPFASSTTLLICSQRKEFFPDKWKEGTGPTTTPQIFWEASQFFVREQHDVNKRGENNNKQLPGKTSKSTPGNHNKQKVHKKSGGISKDTLKGKVDEIRSESNRKKGGRKKVDANGSICSFTCNRGLPSNMQ